MKARKRSVCAYCGSLINVGARIARVREDGRARWVHVGCCLAEAERTAPQYRGRPVESLRPL